MVQRTAESATDANTAEMLAQNFKAEHEIGRRYRIDPAELPPPKTGPIVTNRVLTIPFNGQTLQVPPGFTATPFATGLVNPRRLLVLGNGDVLVAEQSAGYLTLLRDDGEGRAKWISRHVEDLNRPYGLAWQNDNLLVADQDGIWRVPHVIGAVRAGRPAPAQRADQLPPEREQAGARRLWRAAGHQEGRVRHRARPPEPAAGDRPEGRRAVRRGRLVRQYRRRAGAEGDDPALRRERLEPDDRMPPASATRPGWPSTPRPAICGPSCRSATGSATTCPPTS